MEKMTGVFKRVLRDAQISVCAFIICHMPENILFIVTQINSHFVICAFLVVRLERNPIHHNMITHRGTYGDK